MENTIIQNPQSLVDEINEQIDFDIKRGLLPENWKDFFK